MNASKNIETKDLIPGNVLFWTGEEVITTPISLKKGSKVEFVVKTKNGELVLKEWNGTRLILIKR